MSYKPLKRDDTDVFLDFDVDYENAQEREHSRKMQQMRTWYGLLIVGGLFFILIGWKFDSPSSTTAKENNDPEWPTNVGYEGPTPTGAEPFAAATAYPSNYDFYPLKPPTFHNGNGERNGRELLRNFGYLSPWFTVSHGYGTRGEVGVPEGCNIEQVHMLHRHGARYPTEGSTVSNLAKIFHEKRFNATGPLAFLTDWQYKLGSEILTPFGRAQLFNLGVGFRTKYGQLLKNPDGTDRKHKPVFRTESQDRMYKSSLNFAAGFFGIPYEDQYNQLITIEAPGFNNTLSPYMTCPNESKDSLNVATQKVTEWVNTYLAGAVSRINAHISFHSSHFKNNDGLTVQDIYDMQTLCAYEVVALDGSRFCDLFTDDEWEGFRYSHDLYFWYRASFGHPAQAAMGKGWVQELLSRVTRVPIKEFDSTTNSTLHTPQYFPINDEQAIFVDATHDTVISAIITTLRFTGFAREGPLPSTNIPLTQSFQVSHIAPFAANLQAEILDCPAHTADGYTEEEDSRTKYIRFMLNDGIVPLDGALGCKGTMCPVEVWALSTENYLKHINFQHDCSGDYQLGDEPIIDGRPPGSQ